jgi:putative transcriptional regulator
MALRRLALSLAIYSVLGASALLAQSQNPGDLAVGKLLVAPKDSSDPNFAESVILLVHYAGDGTVGLVINRRTTLSGSRVLHALKGAANYSQPAYAGGPVETDVVEALAQLPPGPHDATHLFGKLYLISQKAELEKALAAGKGAGDLRVYLGYAGWGPGQLEEEVTEDGWYIFDGTEERVFDSDPPTLWSRMIARTELRLAQLFSGTKRSLPVSIRLSGFVPGEAMLAGERDSRPSALRF